MNKQLLELFQLKVNKPEITQREIANYLRISLGKTNNLLDKLKAFSLFDDRYIL